MIGFNAELYAKGSARLMDEARHSSRAQAYRRGQNSTQRNAIHPIHTPSCNMKLRGYTQAIQKFDSAIGVMRTWQTPSGKRSTGQNQSQPSLNSPSPTQPIRTRMPWNL